MSSRAAQAMYPALAKQERLKEQAAKPKLEPVTQPAWGKSDHPLWAQPRAAPGDYSKVPGLVKVRR
jgi:hypothetical protein